VLNLEGNASDADLASSCNSGFAAPLGAELNKAEVALVPAGRVGDNVGLEDIAVLLKMAPQVFLAVLLLDAIDEQLATLRVAFGRATVLLMGMVHINLLVVDEVFGSAHNPLEALVVPAGHECVAFGDPSAIIADQLNALDQAEERKVVEDVTFNGGLRKTTDKNSLENSFHDYN
jgi:hypothetical protein